MRWLQLDYAQLVAIVITVVVAVVVVVVVANNYPHPNSPLSIQSQPPTSVHLFGAKTAGKAIKPQKHKTKKTKTE